MAALVSVVAPGAIAQPSAAATGAPAAAARQGFAVLAVDGAKDSAWPLAQRVYATPALRPVSLDEPRARVLSGEAPPPGAGKEFTDLAETRAAIHGQDAPSRQLLLSIANGLHLRGILVVAMSTTSRPEARVFLAETAGFDAALYGPGDEPSASWEGAVSSLVRAFGPRGGGSVAPDGAKHAPLPKGPAAPASTPFYTSGWFWGALGAAGLGVVAAYAISQDSSGQSIHLQMQVPK